MPRIRSIKPEAWRKRPGKLSTEGQNLWVKLVTFADDAGRFPADIGSIVGHGYPHQLELAPSIQAWLDEIVASGLLVIYEVDGEPYGVLPKFRVHQVVNKPTQSRLPEPPKSIQGAFRYDSEIHPVEVREDSGSPTGEVPKAPETLALPEGSGRTTGLDHGSWTTEHGSGIGGGDARAAEGNLRPVETIDAVLRMLGSIGFDALAVDEDRGAIAQTLAERQPPADTDWDVVGQRIRRKLEDGTIERGRPVSALRFIVNGRVGLPRVGGNPLFSSTSPAVAAGDKYEGIG